MEVRTLIDELSKISQPEAERKIEEYGRELANGSDKLSEAKAAYKEVIDTYLSRFPPSFSDDFIKNLKEYEKLIIFSLRSNDKSLLFKWGIQQPRSQNHKWIYDHAERERYAKAFRDLSEDMPGAKEYYDELIKHF